MRRGLDGAALGPGVVVGEGEGTRDGRSLVDGDGVLDGGALDAVGGSTLGSCDGFNCKLGREVALGACKGGFVVTVKF